MSERVEEVVRLAREASRLEAEVRKLNAKVVAKMFDFTPDEFRELQELREAA